MSPSAVESAQQAVEDIKAKVLPVQQKPTAIEADVPETEGLPKRLESHKEPLKLSGALEQSENFEVTPVIGREYVNVDLVEWLRAPNSDELLRDLAITSKSLSSTTESVSLALTCTSTIVSQRGVVFFRKQDNLSDDLQKELVDRLGKLSGKPATSGLHIHPVTNASRELGGGDNEISVISSQQAKALYKDAKLFKGVGLGTARQSIKDQWHSDITFEPIPSDYALLRLVQLPTTGGDTLWASGYELYDRISPTLRSFLDTLTAYYAQPLFNEAAKRNGFAVFAGERGAPENVGEILEAIHPVIRTNPVTGWRSVYAVGHHCARINGLSDEESKHFLSWFVQLIVENHDLQVRLKWQNPNDVAIWDNRSVYHAATPDYIFEEGLGERKGNRAVSLGERPYFDPSSTSRREALKKN